MCKFDFQNSLITIIIRNITDINLNNNNLRNQLQPSSMPLPEGSTQMYKNSLYTVCKIPRKVA